METSQTHKIVFTAILLVASASFASDTETDYKLKGIANVVAKNMQEIKTHSEENKQLKESITALESKITLLQSNATATLALKEEISLLRHELEEVKKTQTQSDTSASLPKNSISFSRAQLGKSWNDNRSHTKNTNPYEGEYFIFVKALSVREFPMQEAKAVGTLTQGTIISFLHCDEHGWCQIASPFQGYVAKHFTRKAN